MKSLVRLQGVARWCTVLAVTFAGCLVLLVVCELVSSWALLSRSQFGILMTGLFWGFVVSSWSAAWAAGRARSIRSSTVGGEGNIARLSAPPPADTRMCITVAQRVVADVLAAVGVIAGVVAVAMLLLLAAYVVVMVGSNGDFVVAARVLMQDTDERGVDAAIFVTVLTGVGFLASPVLLICAIRVLTDAVRELLLARMPGGLIFDNLTTAGLAMQLGLGTGSLSRSGWVRTVVAIDGTVLSFWEVRGRQVTELARIRLADVKAVETVDLTSKMNTKQGMRLTVAPPGDPGFKVELLPARSRPDLEQELRAMVADSRR